MDNKIIIIGNDHINTLGVIRIFGENNIKPIVFLISNKKNNSVIKSKYVGEYYVFTNEQFALKKLLEMKNERKIVIIPTSDSAAICLDENYSKLKNDFYVPNIMKQDKNIFLYMNKYKQQELIKNNNIKGITSRIIDLYKNTNRDILKYPIILKPNISAEGNKNDISICQNLNDFNKAQNDFIEKGYKSVLLQEYIDYKTECDIQGYSINGNAYIPAVIEKIRIWPVKKGSTTYGKVVPIDKYTDIIVKIKNLMKELQYTGIFDIDFFVTENDMYLNEINFRNSAISYACGNCYISYYWYLSCISNNIIKSPVVKEDYYFLNDQADIHNVLEKNISFNKYLKDKKSAKILLVKNKQDIVPSRYLFINKIKNKIFK